MAVYKNKYNLWSVQGKYKDGTGNYKNYHRFKDKNGFKLKKEAVEADLKLRRELSEVGRYVPAHQMTFKDLCEEYYSEKKRILKYSTIYSDMKIMKRAAVLDELLLKDIMPKTIQQILDDMDAEGLSLNYIRHRTGCEHRRSSNPHPSRNHLGTRDDGHAGIRPHHRSLGNQRHFELPIINCHHDRSFCHFDRNREISGTILAISLNRIVFS